MRRPRSKLEVSTFPFLAVLLCAMGALLLLLFIMDRRAKIAAQHTASEAVAELKKRTEAEEQARQEEWQKAKDLLHQSLLDQHGQLLADAKGVQQNLDDAGSKVANAQSMQAELKGKLERENSKIATLHAQLVSQRAGLKDIELKDSKQKAELIEAAKELAELERAFKQLKALKENEKQVYSVVPYRGKHGQARTPIYVECVRGGVIFHPEKKKLEGWEFTPEIMKEEVERRTGTLNAEKSAKEKSRTIAEERKGPYVLFLIRPEGIASYYAAQAGLKGYDLDFGYELVDQDWVLDFNGDPNAKPAPPSTMVAKNIDVKKAPIGSTVPRQGPLLPPPALGNPTYGSAGGVPFSPGQGNRSTGNAGTGGQSAAGSPASGGDAGTSMKSGQVGGPPSKGASFVPIAKTPQLGPVIPNLGGAGAKADPLRPIGLPIPGQQSTGNGPSGGSPTAGVAESKSDQPAFGKSMPFAPGDDAKKPAPPPVSRILGNRDFIITIDCYADHATVFPSGLQYRWSGPNPNASDKGLVDAVSNLITKRQATVRTGEPPYRPLIRFQVSPDGLRTYLRIYPLLAPLNVMMTRENVQE